MTRPYFYIIEHINSGKKYAGAKWGVGCSPEKFIENLSKKARDRWLLNNPMDNPESRRKVGESKIGRKIAYREDGSRYLQKSELMETQE